LLDAMSVRSYSVNVLDNLGELGLDPPQASVSFDNLQIDVGTTDAIENLRYLRVGNIVHLVADRFQHLPNAGFSNFVQRALLPDDAPVTALQLPGLSLTQADGVHWSLQPPLADVSADAIDALIAAWGRTNALYVRRYDPAAAPDTATDTVLVRQGGTRPIEFRILAREPDLVLARPEWGIQYYIPADTGAELLTLPESADSGAEPPGLPEIAPPGPAL